MNFFATDMNELQLTAARKAINLLAGLKAEFKVILPNGLEFGDLKIVPEVKKRQNYEAMYSEVIETVPVGEMFSFRAPDELEDVGNLSSAIGMRCRKVWGNGNYSVKTKGRNVHAIRLG